MRPASLLTVLLVGLLVALPAAADAQAPERIQYTSFGRAQLELPDLTRVQVGVLGGGLKDLEVQRPETRPLAARFRMQRRTGLLLGAAAMVGGALAFHRVADTSRPPLQMGDPQANILMGAMGAMTLSWLQLDRAHRTLAELADGIR